ncbi:MAG: hypothetical protein Q8P60_09010 [Pseudorhodobacter sp.]|nr:hypothetical protein [Pseudorhodobacter sp.]
MTRQRTAFPEFAVFAALWQKKTLITAISIFAVGVGYFAGRLSTPVYQAESSLIFRFDREYMPRNLADESWHGEPVRVDLDVAIHTDLEILGSRRLLERILAQVGPGPASRLDATAAPIPLDKQIDVLRRALSIRRIEGTTVVKLTFDHPDPVYAREFLTSLLAMHQAERKTLLDWSPLEAVQQVVDWAAQQEAAAQEKVTAFRLAHGGQEMEAARAALTARRSALIASPPEDAAAPTPIAEQIAKVDALLALLATQEGQLNALQVSADLAGAQHQKAREIATKQALSGQLSAALGSAIIVLDAPMAKSDPIGLSAAAKAILTGVLGFGLACLLALWLARGRNGTFLAEVDPAKRATIPPKMPSPFSPKPPALSAQKTRSRTR